MNVMSKPGLLEQLATELMGWRYRPLQFPRSIEEGFLNESVPFRRRRLWLEGVIGIALYVGFISLNAASSGSSSMVRLFAVLPVVLTVNVVVLLAKFEEWQELAILVASCYAGTIEILLSLRAGERQPAWALLAIVGVLVFTNGIMRLRMIGPGNSVPVGMLVFGQI